MEDRFWSKVKRGTDDECWEWLGCKQRQGYGWTKRGLAHRVAWELTHNKIPEGLVVRHKCRGKCVNPNHMELGTYAENNADKVRDGTSTRGETNRMSRLTEEQVRTIKHRLTNYERGMVKQLATEYGVSRLTISSIKSGQNWGWIV